MRNNDNTVITNNSYNIRLYNIIILMLLYHKFMFV